MASKTSFGIAFTLGLILVCTSANDKQFNVLSYGAKADGVTDDSKAFLSAWKDACEWSSGTAILLIPSGKYMLYSANFIGPCKGSITFRLQGIIKAPTDPSIFCNVTWISFQYVNGLEVEGGGTLDGQGASGWPYYDPSNSNPKCPTLPSTLKFDFVQHSAVHDINSVNSKSFHFDLFKCNNMTFSHVNLTAPGDSPNTDGIHIGVSTNIQITDSNIGTGDDCISMIQGTQYVNISGVTCGPGHGISIGSLGKTQNELVSNIYIKSCTLTGTQNGARIKTWAPSTSGIAKNINFEDLIMDNVRNPIIIDQHYCLSPPCSSQASSVQVKDVTFNNIRGTSSSVAAVTLNCSSSFPCQVKLNDINLVYKGAGGPAISSCANAHGTASGKELPPSCLKSSIYL